MKYILLIFFAMLLSISTVYALDCAVRSADCLSGETGIFKMSQTTNGHASLFSQSGYTYTVCCNDVGTSCTANYKIALRLSAVTNAHAQTNAFSNYLQEVCISSGCGETVDVVNSDQLCPEGYACLASLSSDNNAHIGNCTAYDQLVCIKFDPHINPDVSVLHSPTEDIYQSTDVTFTATGAVNTADLASIKIYVDGAMKNTSTLSPCIFTEKYAVGLHTYYATIEDSCSASGRDPDTGTNSFEVKHIQPVADITYSPSMPDVTDYVTFTATATTSDGANINSIKIYVDGVLKNTNTSSSCTFTGGPYSKGLHTYSANVTDTMEGKDGTAENSFYVGGAAPACGIVHSPANPNSHEQVTFTAVATPYGSAFIKNITIFVDGLRGKTCLSSPCIFTGGPYSFGAHSYSARVFDNSNLECFSSGNFQSSHSMPRITSLTINPPYPYKKNNLTFNISGESYDGVYIKQIELFVDGVHGGECNYSYSENKASATCVVTTLSGKYALGYHTYYARITDYVNASGVSIVKNFTVLHTKPMITSLRAAPNPAYSQDVISFMITGVSYDDVYIYQMELFVDNSSRGRCTYDDFPGVSSITCTIALGTFSLGQHTFYGKITDYNGSYSISWELKFTVLHTPPNASASHTPQFPTILDTVAVTGTGRAFDGYTINRSSIFVRPRGQTTWTGYEKKVCTGTSTCVYSALYPPGQYEYFAEVSDTYGAIKNSTRGYFTVTKVPLNIVDVNGSECSGLGKPVQCVVTADRDIDRTVEVPLGCSIENSTGAVKGTCTFVSWLDNSKASFSCTTPTARGEYSYVGFVKSGNPVYSMGPVPEGTYPLNCICTFTSARLYNSTCKGANGTCNPGDNLTLNLRYTGACVPLDGRLYAQLDASDTNNSCKIEAVNPGAGAWIKGINATCIGLSPCQKLWQIPLTVPEECKGKILMAKAAGLYETAPAGDPGSVYIKAASAVSGRFRIYRNISGGSNDTTVSVSVRTTIRPGEIITRPDDFTIEISAQYYEGSNPLVDCDSSKCALDAWIERDPADFKWDGSKWVYRNSSSSREANQEYIVSAIVTHISGAEGVADDRFIINRIPNVDNPRAEPLTIRKGERVIIRAEVTDPDTDDRLKLDENMVLLCDNSGCSGPNNKQMTRESGNTFKYTISNTSGMSGRYIYWIRATDKAGANSPSYQVNFSVSSKDIRISISYPDLDERIIELTPTGLPNFTRSMPIRFLVKGQIVEGSSAEDCTGAKCSAYYLKNSSWISMRWDEFEQAFNGSLDSRNLECDKNSNLTVKVEKKVDPDKGIYNIMTANFYINCIPKLTVVPHEKRFALGDRDVKAVFMVTVWNPRDEKAYDVKMIDSLSTGVLNWVEFDCKGMDPSDCDKNNFEYTIPERSALTIPVDLNSVGAARTGLYSIKFEADSEGKKYSDNGVIMVFSEGLPEFTFIHIIVLIMTALLLVYIQPWKKEP